MVHIMRWILIFLLFANAGYFVWGYYQQSHQNYPEVQAGVDQYVQEGKRIVLLSETRLLEKPEPKPVQTKAEPEESEEIGAKEEQCLVIGPFKSSAKADQLQQKLFSLGVASKERSDNETARSDYWVHIPPLPNRQAAIRLLRELQSQKIDSFVITQGELANGISLGLFSKEKSANEVSRRLLESGYQTAIKVLQREAETFWLEVTVKEAEKLGGRTWSDITEEHNSLKMLEKNCKGIASTDSIH